MANITKSAEGARLHIKSPLMRESLLDKNVIESSDTDEEIAILPDVNVVALGGQSIIDRGKAALFPLLNEIVRCREHHKIILGVGGGTRTRHTFDICLDLGIPTGGLAMVAGGVDEQNTRMIGALLAKHKGIPLNKDHFLDLPLWLEYGMIPITSGMPPYHYWEPPTGDRRVPGHGEDLGLYMIAEVLGARSIIYCKDEDGMFTDDPKKNPDAKLIPRVSAQELIAMDLDDMIIERSVVQTLCNARHATRVRIINGLKPEMLVKALNGEEVGTLIYTERKPRAKQQSKAPVASAERGGADG